MSNHEPNIKHNHLLSPEHTPLAPRRAAPALDVHRIITYAFVLLKYGEGEHGYYDQTWKSPTYRVVVIVVVIVVVTEVREAELLARHDIPLSEDGEQRLV